MSKGFPTILTRKYSSEESDRIDIEREHERLSNALAKNYNDSGATPDKGMSPEYAKRDNELRDQLKELEKYRK